MTKTLKHLPNAPNFMIEKVKSKKINSESTQEKQTIKPVNNITIDHETTQEKQTIKPVNNITIDHETTSNELFGFKQSKVMIIDADKSIQRELSGLLQNWQCETQCFDSINEAILILDEQSLIPNLLISDFHLGIDTVKIIQEFYDHNIPAIILICDKESIKISKDRNLTILHKPIKAAQLRFVMKKKLSTHY